MPSNSNGFNNQRLIDTEILMLLLLQMLAEMNDLSNGDYLFQQDGARSHTAVYTLNYLLENMSATAELVVPEDWPTNSPDFNPMDYGIWSILANSVFSVTRSQPLGGQISTCVGCPHAITNGQYNYILS